MLERSCFVPRFQPRSNCSWNRCCLHSWCNNISVFIQGKHFSCKGFKNRNGKWFRAELEKKQNVTTSSFPWCFYFYKEDSEKLQVLGLWSIFYDISPWDLVGLKTEGSYTLNIFYPKYLWNDFHISCDFRGWREKESRADGHRMLWKWAFSSFSIVTCFWLLEITERLLVI